MEPVEGDAPVLTLLLIRHGQCTSNLQHLVSGRTDSQLTEQGQQEAELLGKYVRKQKILIDRIYTSPLLRAYKTALTLAGEQQVIVDRRLIEKFYGVCEGIPEMEWFQQMKESKSDPYHYTPEGAESSDSVHQRLTDFFWSIINDLLPAEEPTAPAPSITGNTPSTSTDGHQGVRRTVAAVTHGAVLYGFALFFIKELGALTLEDPSSAPICNTGVCRLDFWRDAEGQVRGKTVYLNRLDHINGANINVKGVAAGKLMA